MSELTIDRLRKVYSSDDGDIVAVDDLSLTVQDGEFLVFVGPSGCGKSTTLRSIAGLENVTEGSIRLGGTDITAQKPKNRNIAMVFQNYALYPHMSARDNMSFGLRVNSALDDDAITARVEEVASLLGITPLLEKRPGSLSGGQQQRVALGRAIVREPAVFLMDEPLSNLDAKLRTQMQAELKTLQTELDVTTIYVTHDQTEAMTMGDRIAILNDGRLQQCAPPLDCYYKPANKFVAEFIGSPTMNFFPATRRGDRLGNDAFELDLSPGTVEGCGDVTDLVLGVRPEDLSLAHGDDALLSGVVEVIQPTGDETYLEVSLGDDSCVVSIDPRRSMGLTHGDAVDLTFDEESIYLFDRATEESLKWNTQLEQPSETNLP